MSTELPKNPAAFYKLPNKKIAIVASLWHKELIEMSVKRAVEELVKIEVAQTDIFVHWVPGSMEIPFATKLIFENQLYIDAIITFGIVLRGITTHDQQVMQNVTEGIRKISLKYSKPIIHEVTGVNSIEDAKQRFGYDKPKPLEAVFAVSEILHWQDQLINNS